MTFFNLSMLLLAYNMPNSVGFAQAMTENNEFKSNIRPKKLHMESLKPCVIHNTVLFNTKELAKMHNMAV